MSVTLSPQGLDFVQYKLAEKFVVRNPVIVGVGKRGWRTVRKLFSSVHAVLICVLETRRGRSGLPP